MIDEEVLEKVRKCFKQDGIEHVDQVKGGVAVILNAVFDDPTTICKTPDRLTEEEARLIAELVGHAMKQRELSEQLSARLEQGVQLNVNMISDLQHHIDADDLDEVDVCQWFADAAGIPLSSSSAVYDHIKWLESVGADNEDAARADEREIYEKKMGEVRREAQRSAANAWNAGEVERQKALRWREKAKKLRLALIQLAEAPKMCEHCQSKLLTPDPQSRLPGSAEKKPE